MNLRNRITTTIAATLITITPTALLTTPASASTTTNLTCTTNITGTAADATAFENHTAVGTSLLFSGTCTGTINWNNATQNGYWQHAPIFIGFQQAPISAIYIYSSSDTQLPDFSGTFSWSNINTTTGTTTGDIALNIVYEYEGPCNGADTSTCGLPTGQVGQATAWNSTTLTQTGTNETTINGVPQPPPPCSAFGVTGPQAVYPGHAYTFGLGWLGECDTIIFQTPLDPGFTTGNTPSDYQANFGGTYADAFFQYTSGNIGGGNATMDINLTNATATNWPNSWETQTEVWGVYFANGTTIDVNLGSLSGLIAATANGGQPIYTNPTGGSTTPTTVPGTTCTGTIDPYPLQPATTPCPTGTNPVQGAGFNFSQCTAGISMSLWNPGSWIAGAAQYGACVVELLFIPNTNNAFTQTIADAKTHVPFNYVSDTIDGANTLVNGLTTQAATGTCSPPTIAPWTGQTGALAGLAKFSFTVPLPTAVCGAQAGGIDPNVGNMWGFRPYWIDLLTIMIYLAAFVIIWETTPWGRNGATVIRAIGHADGYTLYSDQTASKDD